MQGDNNQRAENKVVKSSYIISKKRQREKYNQNRKRQTQEVQNRQQEQEEMKEYTLKRQRNEKYRAAAVSDKFRLLCEGGRV